MTAHEDITDALDKLAAHGSADQIAAHLAEQGHAGLQGVANACPLANYVHATTGQRIVIDGANWGPDESPWLLEQVTSHELGKFVAAFDYGSYPQLIKAAES